MENYDYVAEKGITVGRMDEPYGYYLVRYNEHIEESIKADIWVLNYQSKRAERVGLITMQNSKYLSDLIMMFTLDSDEEEN